MANPVDPLNNRAAFLSLHRRLYVAGFKCMTYIRLASGLTKLLTHDKPLKGKLNFLKTSYSIENVEGEFIKVWPTYHLVVENLHKDQQADTQVYNKDSFKNHSGVYLPLGDLIDLKEMLKSYRPDTKQLEKARYEFNDKMSQDNSDKFPSAFAEILLEPINSCARANTPVEHPAYSLVYTDEDSEILKTRISKLKEVQVAANLVAEKKEKCEDLEKEVQSNMGTLIGCVDEFCSEIVNYFQSIRTAALAIPGQPARSEYSPPTNKLNVQKEANLKSAETQLSNALSDYSRLATDMKSAIQEREKAILDIEKEKWKEEARRAYIAFNEFWLDWCQKNLLKKTDVDTLLEKESLLLKKLFANEKDCFQSYLALDAEMKRLFTGIPANGAVSSVKSGSGSTSVIGTCKIPGKAYVAGTKGQRGIHISGAYKTGKEFVVHEITKCSCSGPKDTNRGGIRSLEDVKKLQKLLHGIDGSAPVGETPLFALTKRVLYWIVSKYDKPLSASELVLLVERLKNLVTSIANDAKVLPQ